VTDGFIWAAAEVTYRDWDGTAHIDERMTGAQLNELVGLDSDEWMIVGLDICAVASAATSSESSLYTAASSLTAATYFPASRDPTGKRYQRLSSSSMT
jgi:hypothetical protein